MFDPLAVISTIPAYATRRTACVLHTHYKEQGAYEICASNLKTAALSVLPVAAYSQGKPAPADAFLYIIWPPNDATLKGAFWCRFGLRNMGVTQARSDAAFVATKN
jgi:hypothetical protein